MKKAPAAADLIWNDLNGVLRGFNMIYQSGKNLPA